MTEEQRWWEQEAGGDNATEVLVVSTRHFVAATFVVSGSRDNMPVIGAPTEKQALAAALHLMADQVMGAS